MLFALSQKVAKTKEEIPAKLLGYRAITIGLTFVHGSRENKDDGWKSVKSGNSAVLRG
jgi:hypothetical protein